MNIRLSTRGAKRIHRVDYEWGWHRILFCGRMVLDGCTAETDEPITCRICRKGVERRALTTTIDTESDADE